MNAVLQKKRLTLERSLLNLPVIFVLLCIASTSYAQMQGTGPHSPSIVAPPAAEVACLPPACNISGSTTLCPGSPTLLCAPVGLASYHWSTGETTQCINVSIAGTYLVTVGATGGCTSTCSKTVSSISCNITGNTSMCQGGSTQLCANAGASSYQWNTGATTQCITVTSTGTYTVTVCINGCFMTCDKTVTGGSISCNISGQSNVCSGNSTQLCATAGMSSYLWSTGATTQCVNVSNTGTYSVTVSSGGCTSSCNKTVTFSQPLPCNITGNTSICGGGSTQLCLPAGYSYSWNTGATTQCITVSAAGTYYGNINNGTCNTTCNKTVTVNSGSCSISGNSSICQGGTTQLCAAQGWTNYNWSTGATTQCINVSNAGTYTVSVSGNGCSSSCSKTVTIGSISCSISGPSSSCSGSSVQICAPAGMASYTWSTGATTQCINVSSTGTYSVTVSNGGCSSMCSKTVNINTPLPCNITGNTTICGGGSTQLCLPAGYTYSWNTGATTQCITVSAAGTYYGNINDGTCNTTCHKTVTVSSGTCNITGNTSICQGGTTQLCAAAGWTNYNWSTGATTQCINVSSAGTFTVSVSGNGCSSSCSKTVTIGSISCSITGPSNVCSGSSCQLCAIAGMSSYLWSTGASTQCITASNTGTYTVTVSSGGCTSSCSKTVTINPPIVCNISGNAQICAGGSTQLCLPAGYSSYSWNTGATTQCINVNAGGTYTGTVSDGVCSSACDKTVTVNSGTCNITGNSSICPGGSTQICAAAGWSSYIWNNGLTTQCINVSSAGSYTVTVSGNGCTSSCSKTISIGGSLNCSITGNNIGCSGTTTQICATGGMSSYLWSTGATTQCVTVSAGTYSVTISDGSCTSTCSKTITSGNQPNCNITGNSFICPGGSSQLCAGGGFASYNWSTGATTQCINANSAANYSVVVTDANGCSSSCSKGVFVNTPPNCSITGGSTVCAGGSTQLCGTPGLVGYLWSTGATTDCINVNSAANYSVVLTDAHGCTSSCSKQVTVNNPSCNITGNTSLCGGQTSLCGPAGASSYVWSNGATTQCINVITAGTYSITVTQSGCVSNCSKTVTGGATCSISGCATITPGSATSLCASAGGASYLWNTGATTRCISTTSAGSYTVSVTDANNCTTTCSQTQITQICYASPTNTNVNANQTWTINTTNQTVTIRTTFAKTFVDNTYGTNAIGWPGGHTFSNLTGSDHVQLALYDANNVKKMEFKLDYITASNLAASGYKSLGVTGGDGGMVLGSAADVLSAKTSMDVNFNDFNYILTTNSPATNANYTPNATYPNWVFDVWYEVTVRLSAFPAGFGKPLISDIHASPSKTGHNTEIVVDTPCTPCINPLILGDLVWFDTNNNGMKDAAEPGLGGYVVKLYNDVDNNDIPDGASIAQTTTNGSGIYGFNGLIPGNYIVGVVLHNGDNPVAINGGDPDNNINNDNNGLNVVGGELRSNSVTLNFGTEPTNDGDNSDGNLSVDFAIFKTTNDKCYVGVSHHNVYATQSWTFNVNTNSATIRTTFSKNFVDNTYGVNKIGWPNNHSFSDLVGSDKLQLALYDVNNVKKMEFKLDYISTSNTVASGYKSLGVLGGDGGMVLGNASDVLSVKTSLDANFNDFGYILTTNSPATNTNYTPNATYPNWIYDVWYEVTVNLGAFPAGFGEPVVTDIHASPSKTGSNTEVMNDTVCIFPRLASKTIDESPTGDFVVNAYPNPFKAFTTIEFQRSDKSSHVKLEVFTLSGKKVATLFDNNVVAGEVYTTQFNAEGLPNGIYLYRIESDDKVINGKLILMN